MSASSPPGQLRTFYLVAGLVSLALLGGLVLAAQLDAVADLTPQSVQPAPALPLSTQPAIHVRYRRALVAASAQDAVRLEPAVPLSVEVRGPVLAVRPLQPLAPEAAYTLVVAPGVRESGGRQARAEQRYTYRTRAPRLLVVAPGAGDAGGRDNLWSVGLDGGEPRQLTAEEAGVLSASVAPDGDAIAYTAPLERESADRTRLWQVDRTGGKRQRLTPPGDHSAQEVAWSPAGELIVYERRELAPAFVPGQWRPGAPRLWGVRPDGTDLGPIWGRGEQQGELPAFAPDGQRLAFYDASQKALTVYDFTPNPLRLPLALPGTAVWAPDSRRFAYVDRPDPGDVRRSAVYVASVDAPSPRTLTPDAAADFYPAFAPDGAQLALVRRTSEGEQGIWQVAVDSADALPLQTEPGWMYSRPLWAPTGDAVYWSRIPLGRSAASWELWAGTRDGAAPPRRLGEGRVLGWLP